MNVIAEPIEKEFKLTDRQCDAIDVIAGPSTYILLFGGSRSTKTFTMLRTTTLRALAAPGSRHAVLRFRFSHIKSSVIYDTFPKMMALCFPGVGYKINKADWFCQFSNGSEIWFGGLDDKARTEKVLGNEYVTICLNECSQISYQAFLIMQTRLAQVVTYERGNKTYQMRLKFLCDENPPLKGHWSHKLFIDKVDPDTKRALKEPDDYDCIQMNPVDNAENLPPKYLEILQNMPKRQRDRFWLGIFGSENDNALWSESTIEKSKVDEAPETFVRIVIAVDPSGTTGEEETRSDDIGIVVAGLGLDGVAYVLEDLTVNAAPAKWGKLVADAWTRHEADRVIGESNYGGAMVEFVIKQANPVISYKSVHARSSKMIRAEPVSALHENGKIKLVGDFPDLEDELMNSTTAGYMGSRSPNRLDAFVFAIIELFPGLTRKPKKERKPLNIPTLNRM